MKIKYTKKQITEAIAHWEKVLESMDEDEQKLDEQVSRSENEVFVSMDELIKEMQSAAKTLGGDVEVLVKDGQIKMYGNTGMNNIIIADLNTASIGK